MIMNKNALNTRGMNTNGMNTRGMNTKTNDSKNKLKIAKNTKNMRNKNNKNTKKNIRKVKIEKIGKCSLSRFPSSNIRKTVSRLLEEQNDNGLIVLYDIDTPYGIEDKIGPKKTFVHYLKVGDNEYISLMEPSPPRPKRNMENKNTHRYYLSHYECNEDKIIKFLDQLNLNENKRNGEIYQELLKGKIANKKLGKLKYKKRFVVYNVRN